MKPELTFPEEGKYYILKYTRKNDTNKCDRIALVAAVVPRFNQILLNGAVRIDGEIRLYFPWSVSREKFWKDYVLFSLDLL